MQGGLKNELYCIKAFAETDFTDSLSNAATWNGNGTCSNLYCHGDRSRDNGEITHTAQIQTCHDCHPDPSSGRDAWRARFIGERHEDHLREGMTCSDCHGATTNAGLQIIAPALHVDGEIQLQLPSGITHTGTTCTGSCHGENHQYEQW